MNQPPPQPGELRWTKKPPFSITKGLLLHAHCGDWIFGSDKFEIELGGILHN